MTIITLNTWGGRAGHGPLLDFFRSNAETDVFCLQEVWSAPYEIPPGRTVASNQTFDGVLTEGMQEIARALPDHVGFFRPHYRDHYGLYLLVKKTWTVLQEGEAFVHRHKGYEPEEDIGKHARNVQYVVLQTANGPLAVLNFHGLWNGQGKGDSEERIEQSRRLLGVLKELPPDVVFCGDFNVNPDTQSLRLLEEAGFRNLVREHGVSSTRTSLYTKPEKFADYVFVSGRVQVERFSVLPAEISDHAPLRVDVCV